MTAPKTILVGDRVKYVSAAGTIRGEVIKIVDGMCADNKVRPWIWVEYVVNNRKAVAVLANEMLSALKFKVTFRG